MANQRTVLITHTDKAVIAQSRRFAAPTEWPIDQIHAMQRARDDHHTVSMVAAELFMPGCTALYQERQHKLERNGNYVNRVTILV